MGNSPSSRSKARRSSSARARPTQVPIGHTGGTQQQQPPASFSPIPDEFRSLNEVTAALRRHGLESSNLILGIDFTKSNEWSGKSTFNGRNLHCTADPNVLNPYEEVIESIGKTLQDFDDDNIVPIYGFGDEMTSDHSVFTFAEHGEPGFPFEQIRSRYRQVVQNVNMAGPTSFAPLIHEAINVVKRTGEYHILVIVADGQVTRSVDVPPHAVSKNEKETIDAITLASHFPLSIVMVGVGDGPWESMIYFDNYLVHRQFDNFQFVQFHEIASPYSNYSVRETQFALHALMEIPQQYACIKKLNLLGGRYPYHVLNRVPQVMVYPTPQPPVPSENSFAHGVYQPAIQRHNTEPFSNEHTSYEPPTHMPSAVPHNLASAHDGTLHTSSYQPSTNLSASLSNHNTNAWASHSNSASAPAMMSSHPRGLASQASAELELSRLQEEMLCAICEDRKKDTVFQCGHETCHACAQYLSQCPNCRQEIQVRIKRYS